MQDATVGAVIARALEAYGRLVEVGERVEDEWQYVTDLSTAWRARLVAVAAARGSEDVLGFDAAVDAASDEVALITDPHRAIDWLSTFPQVVLAAIGETG